MTTTRTARLLLCLLAASALAACGTAPDAPDGGGGTPDAAGNVTPDAGDTMPDAGETTPDAGEGTPDAGPNIGPSFKVRLFNSSSGTASGGNPVTGQITVSAGPLSLSEYVDVPVGTPMIAFGPPPTGVIDTSGITEGTKLLIGVGFIQNTAIARSMVETDNTDATKRKLDFFTSITTFGGTFGSQTFDTAAGTSTSLLVDGATTEGLLGRASSNAAFHFFASRVPLGGRGVIINVSDTYYLLGAPGPQTALPYDTKVRPVVLTGTPAPLDFKFVAPFGEGVFATGQSLTSTTSTHAWVPGETTAIVAFNAGGETYTKDAPFSSSNEFATVAARYTLLVLGSPVQLVMDGHDVDQSGGSAMYLYNAVPNLRFRASQIQGQNTPMGWFPGANLHVDPFGATMFSFTTTTFRIGFQISNPPANPPSNTVPEPILTVSNLPGYVEAYLFAWSGYRILTVTNEGAINVHPPFAN